MDGVCPVHYVLSIYYKRYKKNAVYRSIFKPVTGFMHARNEMQPMQLMLQVQSTENKSRGILLQRCIDFELL